jgi:hypothetical protein
MTHKQTAAKRRRRMRNEAWERSRLIAFTSQLSGYRDQPDDMVMSWTPFMYRGGAVVRSPLSIRIPKACR